ncbi:uncharacterized protein [Manis javanica]|uniref:uncharacterized protein n=1 Tax=Manis javanica TaxID=9974 RepID=UPI003C6CE66B
MGNLNCCTVGPEDVVEPCGSKAEQQVRSGATVASGARENHLPESLDEELPADGAEGKSPFTSKVASRRGRNNVGHTDRTSPSFLSGHWAFLVKEPWGLITAPMEDCDWESFLSSSSGEEDCPVTEVLLVDQAEETVPVAEEETAALSEMASGTSESDCVVESFLSSGSDEEDCPVTEVLLVDQAEETVPVAEEETAALSEMASGTSESDVGHTERSSPSPLSGHWAFHLKRSRLRRSEHAEDCDVESFRSGMTEEKDCTDSDTESYFSSTSYEEDCPGLCQEVSREEVSN